MARELHRDRPAISREIRRNGWQGPAGRRYRASTAQRKADRRRLRCRRPRLMDEPERRSLAVRPMRDGHWSPEEISGRISEERPDLAVSDSAICRAVESGSLDCELPGHRKAARLLRHHGKRRHRKGSQERRGKVRITHDISERPEEASSRNRTGDWEGDMVAGRQGGACLVTQAGRMSGYLVGGKAARKAHAEASEAMERALEGEAVHAAASRQGQGALGCRGPPGGAGSAGLLLPSPPSMGAGHRRERPWPSRGLVPEGREPRRCQRQRGAGGMRSAQPETTQASQVEVLLGGLPPPVVAPALRIRRGNGGSSDDIRIWVARTRIARVTSS